MINSNYFYLNVVLLMVGTLLIRGSFISLSGKFEISPKIKELFTFIPAAILPALIFPGSFFHADQARLVTLILAITASFFIRNTLFTIVFGLVSLYLLGLVF